MVEVKELVHLKINFRNIPLGVTDILVSKNPNADDTISTYINESIWKGEGPSVESNGSDLYRLEAWDKDAISSGRIGVERSSSEIQNEAGTNHLVRLYA